MSEKGTQIFALLNANCGFGSESIKKSSCALKSITSAFSVTLFTELYFVSFTKLSSMERQITTWDFHLDHVVGTICQVPVYFLPHKLQ